MPPAVRRPSLPDSLTAFAAQADVVNSWAAGLDAAGLAQASRLPGWTARDVLAHLAVAVAALAESTADRRRPTPVQEYVGGYAMAAEEIAEQVAGSTGDPRDALRDACAAVIGRAPWPATVVMFDEPLAAADAVSTRLLELVVHADDVGVAPDRGALGVCCRLLAGVLAARRPGRAVELRVPPYSAVQVLEGAVHRRGTPTAVVSVQPLPWLRLATGRLTWEAAVQAGEVVASGERSDLSAHLPLLR